MIEVVAAGPGTSVQDAGRAGYSRWGVGPSGAADRGSYRRANRIVGNADGAAALELTFGGLVVIARETMLVALAGAPTPIRTDAPRAGFGVPFTLRTGDRLEVGRPVRGVRTYLAVHGGFAVDPVLGSRSTDTLGGLGPPPVGPGTLLRVGPPDLGGPAPADVVAVREPDTDAPFRILLGPREDWTDPGLLDGARFRVRPDSDRVGVRLDGVPLPRRAGELPSEGIVRGAVQLPPDGRPIVLGPDHPVTGGYPVVAVVIDADLDRLAQCRPGDEIRFRVVGGVPSGR